MLGISKLVIKAHGSLMRARSTMPSVRRSLCRFRIIDDITANISYMRVDKHAAKECD
ncbi:MAG: hypothetical protein ACLTG4_06615 [Oscillospiraceae bacterium]